MLVVLVRLVPVSWLLVGLRGGEVSLALHQGKEKKKA